MKLILQILLGTVAFICLSGGMNLLRKGAGAFMPEGIAPTVTLDNLFRFMSGIYFSMGFLMAWVTFHVNETNELIYFLGIVVSFSGLGRLYSRISVGSGGRYLDGVMIFEIILGLVIVTLQYLRSQS